MRSCLALAPLVVLLLTAQSPAAAQSRRGEMRGAWMSKVHETDWPAVMQSLDDNGFNAIFPCFSIGDRALYPSSVLSPAPGGDPQRDELADAIKAAHEHDLELHVWRISWALFRTPPEDLAKFEAAGRLQHDFRGRRAGDDPDVNTDWLCPSHPENRRLEKEAMLELVRDYDIDGIHFDYMRFPNGDYCFCDGCKQRFQEQTGVTVTTWPDDVVDDGPLAEQWRRWHRRLITSLVEEISDAAHAAKPDVFVSLAAWSDTQAGREAFGQDWVRWVRDGLLDFVCPMNYTADVATLTGRLAEQLRLTRGVAPLYSGLGGFRLDSSVDLIEQIEATRAAGADGFVIFSYSDGKLVPWLPDLRATVMTGDPRPTPHGHPPASFAFSGDAVAPPADANRVIAGARLEADITLGWEPPTFIEDESAAAAEQAGALLERALDVRDPVGTYDTQPGRAEPSTQEDRLTGRLLVETPEGSPRFVLGPFDTAYQFSRTLGFPAPKGPFRIAIYGTLKNADGGRNFVVRSPLLVGVSKDDLQASWVNRNLNDIFTSICGYPELSALASLSPMTIQIRATGTGAGDWWLALENGNCRSGAGATEGPDVTVTASAEDFLALALGETTARTLRESGRLDIAGEDQSIARLMALFANE